MQEIVAAIGNADIELGNTALLLLPVLRILHHASQLALHPGFFLCGTTIGIERGMQCAIGEGGKGGNPQVNADVSRGRMHGVWHVHLDLEGHKPMLPLPGDGDVLDGALDGRDCARTRPSRSWADRPGAHPA